LGNDRVRVRPMQELDSIIVLPGPHITLLEDLLIALAAPGDGLVSSSVSFVVFVCPFVDFLFLSLGN
jgi:hypothetical protein